MSHEWSPPPSPYLVPFDGSFRIAEASTTPPKSVDKDDEEKRLKKRVRDIRKQQRKLYAEDKHSVLLVFQAMDAAGKDGTIRAVFTGVNPAGFQVSSFKKPSATELDHDFLWRIAQRLPERGRIGIFNRSHYEEVLVVRVHPEFLGRQRLPHVNFDTLWQERFESIRHMEQHLSRNGTVVLKFFLNVSKEEQQRRLLDRIREPESNWKFSMQDVREREHWPKYMHAFEDALNATSRACAPWYCIPADDKPYMRAEVATIVRDALKSLNLEYPKLDEDALAELSEAEKVLSAS